MIIRFLTALSDDQRGATAIEYALICTLISLAALAAMQGIGNQVKNSFTSVSTTMAV